VHKELGEESSLPHAPKVPIIIPALNQSSDAWRPLVLTECVEGMPPEFAPCLKRTFPNLVYAEELLYPDFRIRLPGVLRPDHKATFLRLIEKRDKVNVQSDWAYMTGQSGQNLIFANSTYSGTPRASTWAPDACMGPAVGYGDFGRSFTRPASPPHAFAVFLSSPDDWSFQHWSDRVAIMLAQADHLLEASGLNATLIVAAPRGAPQLPELWRLAAPRATIVPPRAGMTSERLLYPCHTPLLHPFTRRRIVERILIAAGMDPAGAPLASRKTVAFLTRGDGTSTASRAWLNQEANLAATRALLAERGQREVVEIFSVRTLATDQLAALKFFARARAIVGVHGGAMCNHLWAAPDTLVLEIWPVTADGSKTRSGNVFWEHTALLGQEFWMLPAVSTAPRWDVSVEPSDLVTILRERLGRQPDLQRPVLER